MCVEAGELSREIVRGPERELGGSRIEGYEELEATNLELKNSKPKKFEKSPNKAICFAYASRPHLGRVARRHQQSSSRDNTLGRVARQRQQKHAVYYGPKLYEKLSESKYDPPRVL
ncbi:hypothetical protein L2E82_45337 [Cichorium intybus]|uniref:Uncharacterized protein n=1 Tax=Cichorium intybus TaxID=13427 RepID=A0ACB8ZSP9_CICIN|nr:hypothetical protein L2E82_45337 [Cichorium intybus]